MYDLTDKNSAVLTLQRYLLEVSYATEGLPHLALDGLYGEETRAAVLLFQARNGLAETGEVDPVTWELLYRQFKEAEQARIEQPPLLPPGTLPLSLHTEGNEVLLMQVLLRGMGEAREGLPAVPLNGRFDIETQRVLREYQVQRSLPPSGILDAPTWTALTQDYQNRPLRTACTGS